MRWYRRNGRDLPWRRNPEPYRVWISEIMCQQTQVATVIPYFERFLKAFPTVADLAAADEQSLLRLWEGLGYYRRARSLHAAAKQIVSRHDGVFPDRYEDVLALPGVGRYTAGAILSIASQQRLPILEGNTQRVYSRWIALTNVPTETAANRLLWEFAEAMLPRKRPGEFNQAAMELGALVCFPQSPACGRCPVAAFCQARVSGRVDSIPAKADRPKPQERTEYALVVRDRRGGLLVRPLGDGGRWAGLWDVPRTHERPVDSVAAAAAWLSDQLGVAVTSGPRLRTIRHAVTNYRISLHVHDATIHRGSEKLPPPWRFVTPAELAELPMSVTGRKIVRWLDDTRQPRLPP